MLMAQYSLFEEHIVKLVHIYSVYFIHAKMISHSPDAFKCWGQSCAFFLNALCEAFGPT